MRITSETPWIKGEKNMFRWFFAETTASPAVVSFEDWDGPDAERIKAQQEEVAIQALIPEPYKRQSGVLTKIVADLKAEGQSLQQVKEFLEMVVDAKYDGA